jgi:NADH-ubiquinone oxidoreductase chain 5
LYFTILFSTIAIIYFEYLFKSINKFKLSNLGKTVYGFFNQRFLIEYFYNKFIVNLILKFGGQTTKILDKGSIEYIGPFGLEKGIIRLSKNLNYLNTSIATDYALYISIGFIVYTFTYSINNILNLIEILLITSFLFTRLDLK